MTGPRRGLPTMAGRCAEAVAELTALIPGGVTSQEVRLRLRDHGFRVTRKEAAAALRKASLADPALVTGRTVPGGGIEKLWRPADVPAVHPEFDGEAFAAVLEAGDSRVLAGLRAGEGPSC
jgi:hypothetical protein